jgi:hypothetical protein
MALSLKERVATSDASLNSCAPESFFSVSCSDSKSEDALKRMPSCSAAMRFSLATVAI